MRIHREINGAQPLLNPTTPYNANMLPNYKCCLKLPRQPPFSLTQLLSRVPSIA